MEFDRAVSQQTPRPNAALRPRDVPGTQQSARIRPRTEGVGEDHVVEFVRAIGIDDAGRCCVTPILFHNA